MTREIMEISKNVVDQTNLMLQRFNELTNLRLGSIIKLTSGETGEFIKLKRKNFECKIDGTIYNVPIECYDKTIENKEENKGYETLKAGDLFIINNNGSSEIFSFKEIRNKKIIGINLITQQSTRIATSLYFGKLDVKTKKII